MCGNVSMLHSFGYSLIALQEMNLAYFYPSIFWNCANLIVDSAGIDENEEFVNLIETFDTEDEDEDDDEELSKEEKEEQKKQNKIINYGKIASAIGKMINRGISVQLPDINKSEFTFVPDIETNSIIFGIKGISRINNDLAKNIIDNRPYSSMQDFINRIKINKIPMVNLIKSGCFDKLENKQREDIMLDYINSIADTKKRLTLQNVPMLIRENCIPEKFNYEQTVFNFNKYLKNFSSGDYYKLDERALTYYEQHFDMDLIVQNSKGEFGIKQKEWQKIYKKEMEPLKQAMKDDNSILQNLNNKLFSNVWNKYASGNISKWEMDSVSFYYNDHELKNIDKDKYNISNFFDLPEEPEVDTIWNKDGRDIPIFKLNKICGTVIDKNKLKNIVTLLTEDGVVNVRIYRSQFSKYDRQISVKDEITGKKTVIEKSWFKRGNKIIFTGIRRGNDFVPKVYKSKNKTDFPIDLIVNINDDGTVEVAGERQS